MTDETVGLEKGYYHGVYVLLQFNNEYGVDRKQEQIEMGADTNQEDMQNVVLEDESEHQQSMVFEDSTGVLDDDKSLLHDKMWYAFITET